MFEQLVLVYKLSKPTLQAHAVEEKMRRGVKAALVYRGVYSLADCLALLLQHTHTHTPNISSNIYHSPSVPLCLYDTFLYMDMKFKTEIAPKDTTNPSRFVCPLDFSTSS